MSVLRSDKNTAPRYVVIPDSFKGAASSEEVAAAIAKGIQSAAPEAEILQYPIADGGEGTVDAMLADARSGHKVTQHVTGPRGEPVEAAFGMLTSDTAVVEMAAAAGLPLMGGALDVEHATTLGVGEQVLAAISAGARTVFIGAGGSATNDLGCGAAAALGVKFYDADGQDFVPVGATLMQVDRVDTTQVPEAVRATRMVVMTDVDNPLVGDRGCAAVFGPQKGADAAAVSRLDAGARHVAQLWARDVGQDVAEFSGAGAAGGFAGGLMALVGAELRPGIDALLDALDFESVVSGADAVFTAEGQIDGQSLAGKVPVGVARRAGGVPVFVLAGAVGEGIEAVYGQGATAVFAIGQAPQTLSEAMDQTRENIAATAAAVTRTLVAASTPREPCP